MTDYELAALAIIIVGILAVVTLVAYAAPERLRDVLNVIKVIVLALIGKKRSERHLDGKKEPSEKPRK